MPFVFLSNKILLKKKKGAKQHNILITKITKNKGFKKKKKSGKTKIPKFLSQSNKDLKLMGFN